MAVLHLDNISAKQDMQVYHAFLVCYGINLVSLSTTWLLINIRNINENKRETRAQKHSQCAYLYFILHDFSKKKKIKHWLDSYLSENNLGLKKLNLTLFVY